MSDKKKIIVLSTILVILVIGVVILLIIKNNDDNEIKPIEEECNTIVGGGFSLIFNTNGGNQIDNMNVCIACSPDSYKNLPVPVKEGFTFDGWYYDSTLTKKVNATSTLNITPVEDINEKGCKTGYKDITLYAKWI